MPPPRRRALGHQRPSSPNPPLCWLGLGLRPDPNRNRNPVPNLTLTFSLTPKSRCAQVTYTVSGPIKKGRNMEFAGVATQIAPCPDNPSPPPPPPPPPPPFCDPTCHTQLLNGNSFYSESVVRAISGIGLGLGLGLGLALTLALPS